MSVAATGFFDGMHLGHIDIIKRFFLRCHPVEIFANIISFVPKSLRKCIPAYVGAKQLIAGISAAVSAEWARNNISCDRPVTGANRYK